MKLNGTFTLREIAGEILVIPVGQTALDLNGMIVLNPVSRGIWECLEKGTDREQLLKAILDRFDVDESVAKEDMESFLSELSAQKLLEEE